MANIRFSCARLARLIGGSEAGLQYGAQTSYKNPGTFVSGRREIRRATRTKHRPQTLPLAQWVKRPGAANNGNKEPTAMSSGFEERKTAAEAKFKHDEEFKFKVMARRNKLLGLWAAGLMGIDGADAEAYAKQVVVSDFDEPGDDDVLRKVLGDLQAKGRSEDETAVRRQMDKLLDQAKHEMTTE
jgi:hypothetical protein